MGILSNIIKKTIEDEIEIKMPSQDDTTFLRQYLLEQQRIFESREKSLEKRLSEERAEKLFWREKAMKLLEKKGE